MNEPAVQPYLTRLQADFPDLNLENATMLSGGMDHVAVDVDGIIFRLAKEQARGLRVGTEMAMLKRLHGKLPVAIPNPTHIAPGGDYFGYPKLPGDIAASHPSITQTDTYLDQWITIVQAIHASISVDEAYALGLPHFNPRTHFGYYERVVALSTHDDTDPTIRDYARRTLAQIDAINLEGREQYFLHNDFHAKNVLVDPSTLRITGLIDWSDMIVGPLECEFWVWEWDAPEILPRVAERYAERTGRHANLDEARTWLHFNELADYYDAVMTNDAEEAAEVLAHIQRWIGEGK